MFKLLASLCAALFLGSALALAAVAAPAAAHHTDISAKATCADGGWDITWTVINSENKTAEVIESNRPAVVPVGTVFAANPHYGGPSSLTNTVVQRVWSTSAQTLTLKTKWSNGVIDTTSGSVSSFPSGCALPDDTVDCLAATVYTGGALTNGNHINMTLTQDGHSFQTNAYIDIRQSQDPPSESGLVVRITQKTGPQVVLPISNAQKSSGVFRFDYSSYLSGEWTVTWVQFDTHNRHFEGSLRCGEPVKDAAASVTLLAPSCVSAGSLVLNAPTWATWGPYAPSVGPFSVVATAMDGHRFPADVSPGQTVSADGTTKTFAGTVLAQKPKHSADCAQEAVPVSPAVTPAPACGAGSVTPTPTTGVHYVLLFDSASGDYTVTATPEDGHYFPDDDDQVIVFSGNVGAFSHCVGVSVSHVAGVCVYDQEASAADRTATITYDNSGSTMAVQFSGIPGHDALLVAGAVSTFDIVVGPAGAAFTVTADGVEYPVLIPACPSFPEPPGDGGDVVTEKFGCGSPVEITTIAYTVPYLFDPTALVWVAQPAIAGEPVVSHRAMTSEEVADQCGVLLPTDPSASSCDDHDADSPYARFIRVGLEAHVVYTISDADPATPDIVATDVYTELPAGDYTLTASAEPGWRLQPAAERHWSFPVRDQEHCDAPDHRLAATGTVGSAPAVPAAALLVAGASLLGLRAVLTRPRRGAHAARAL